MATGSWNPMPEGLPRPPGSLPGGGTARVPWSQDGGKWGETAAVGIDLAREFSRCLVCGGLVVAGKALVLIENVAPGALGDPQSRGSPGRAWLGCRSGSCPRRLCSDHD